MRLNRLVLRNFGLFRGEQTFDLTLRGAASERPIILIGGHNGAGKTTLLEAVRVCLHGRLSLGQRVTDVAYYSYLRDRLYRGTDGHSAATYASVGLEFEYSHLGSKSRYFVQRGWEPRGSNSVKEGIRVLRDGNPLDDVDAELWPEFVRSLVPPGIAQLFFFDGEKIKCLAEEDTEAYTLAESVKALLGLDLVERLQADLDVYTAKQTRHTAQARTAQRMRELDKELKSLRAQIEEAECSIATAQDHHSTLQASISKLEEKLAQSGEGLASQRENLRQEEADLAAELSATEKAVRDLFDGTAPFLLCSRLGLQLLRQLDLEQSRQNWDVGHVHVREAVKAIRMRLTAPRNRKGHLDNEATAWVQQTIREVEGDLASPPEKIRSVAILHGLSDEDRQACIQAIQLGAPQLSRRFSLHAKKLLALEGELRECRQRINRAPEAAELAPIVSELSGLQEQMARVGLDLTLLAERRATLQKEIATREREQDKLEREEIASVRASARLALAVQARDIAGEYLTRLTATKTRELEREALHAFQRLCRKDHFVHSMRINPHTFAVSLHDSRGDLIPKPSLSAGEKQVYAVSLLWGLARVSGRPLPMIIDTPLGRLDSRHRSNLVQHYFPAAAHQVILLSTDTEVDRMHYAELQPRTSRIYQLVDRDGWTEAQEGYFWEDCHVSSDA